MNACAGRGDVGAADSADLTLPSAPARDGRIDSPSPTERCERWADPGAANEPPDAVYFVLGSSAATSGVMRPDPAIRVVAGLNARATANTAVSARLPATVILSEVDARLPL